MDVGTSTTKVALAEIHHYDDINILGVAQVPSLGLRKGNIIDIESTAKAIDNCLNDLERLTGVPIYSTIAGFSGTSISAINNHAVVAVGNPNNEITAEDKERVIHSARNVALPPDKTVIQIIERQYIVDGYDGVKDPVGMVGSRLEAEVTIIIAATAAIQNMQRSTQRINLQLSNIVYNPLLVSETVLLPAEKEMGVVLMDIGAGTIDISFFAAGSILYTSVLPVGGEYITKDLAIVLRTSLEEAARIKKDYGIASPEMADSSTLIEVRNIQGKEVKQVSQEVVSEIINARVVEIIEMIYAELNQFECWDRIPGGIVLTGGGAELAGITGVMEKYLNVPVRLGVPDNLRGIPADFSRPRNASVLGGLVYSAKNLEIAYDEEGQGLTSIFNRISYWFIDLFR
ncbi:MAG: cell division protein FtsA [Syntrophomonadaceae bacterium]|nr:cell division protein FtsA [Syntrophomonadaceae bacterium]